MEYTPQEKEILRQHYRRPWRVLTRLFSWAKPWIGYVIYGLAGSFAAVLLAVSGPSLFKAEPFLDSSFRSGGFPFNVFSGEILPGIPKQPMILSAVLMNFLILIVCFFIMPLLIYRRRRMIALSRLIFLAIIVSATLILLWLGVRDYNQPTYGGLIDPDELLKSFDNY